jgi:hypothetical protein
VVSEEGQGKTDEVVSGDPVASPDELADEFAVQSAADELPAERNAQLLGEQIRAATTHSSWTGEPEAKGGPTTDDLVPIDETYARFYEEQTKLQQRVRDDVNENFWRLVALPHRAARRASSSRRPRQVRSA